MDLIWDLRIFFKLALQANNSKKAIITKKHFILALLVDIWKAEKLW